MNALKSFVREIHRRSLWQVLGIFLAASWGVVEVVDLLTEQVGLPDWTPTMAFVLLLIGLPVVLATAIVQEGMPGAEGLSKGPANADGATGDAAGSADASPTVTEAGAAGAVPDNLAAGTGSLDRPSTRPSQTRRMLTWKNAVLGGVGAFTLLGFSIFAYFVMWTSGIGPVGNLVAQGVFEEGEAILLSDFADRTGGNLGDVVTEALRVDLQESAVLNLLAPAYVADAMARMGRPEDAVFDAATARELAVRDGFKAVIQGEVASVGSSYLLTASLVAAQSGDVLKAFRVPVASEDELLAGIDKLSQDIREKSGESLRTIRQGTPLAQATTSSLAALRLYSQAIATFDRGRELDALPLLEEALELDAEFAMAWRKLAVILSNSGIDPARMREATTRAFDLRRRLTEREAGLAEAWYRSTIEDDHEGAIDAYLRLLERYADEWTAMNNAGVRLLMMGRAAEAEQILVRALEEPIPGQNVYGNVVHAQWNVGKPEAAWATHEAMMEAFPEASNQYRDRAWLLAAEGRWSEAHDANAQHIARHPGRVTAQLYGGAEITGSDLGRGRYAEAMEHLARADRNAVAAQASELYMAGPAWVHLFAALALSDSPTAAREALEHIVEIANPEALSPRGNGWRVLMGFYALAGDSQRGDEMLQRYEDVLAPEERGFQYRSATSLYAALRAFGTGDYAAAAAAFDILHGEVVSCGAACIYQALHGIALEETGRPVEAIEQYEAYLTHGPLSWHAYLSAWTPTVLERLAGLYEAQGDTDEARATLQQIIDEYSEGDGPFVAYVQRARQRLASFGE